MTSLWSGALRGPKVIQEETSIQNELCLPKGILIREFYYIHTYIHTYIQMVPISLRHVILFIHLTLRDNNLITNNPID